MSFADPDFVASFRFLTWTAALAAAIVLAHYRHHNSDPNMKVRLSGAVMVKFGLAAHQCYYWLKWRHSTDVDIQTALESIRHITSATLVMIVLGNVLIMQPFFERYAGRWWWPAGLACLVVLWAIGYGDAKWRA